MNDNPGLIVCSPTAIESSVAFGRLERFAIPGMRVPGRLNIMVGIEQDGRVPGRGISTSKYGRLPVAGCIRKRLGDYVDLLKNPETANALRDKLGGTPNLLGRETIPRHARNPHQRFEGFE
jgi:hypothetical protein